MSSTVVLQSHRSSSPGGWLGECCASVRRWAAARAWDYRFCDDALFERLPPALYDKLAAQPVVAADLARLYWLRDVLREGFERAIWCDADLLVFADFAPMDTDHAFGREHWLQRQGTGMRHYRKIHNAWMLFRADSAVLPFYLDRAETLLTRVRMPVVPQFVGPKLLTALHNVVGFDVEERVGMLSPLALNGLVGGDRAALERTLAGHKARPCAFNLCASYGGQIVDGVTLSDGLYESAIATLLRDGLALSDGAASGDGKALRDGTTLCGGAGITGPR